jgi:hypothetical protein
MQASLPLLALVLVCGGVYFYANSLSQQARAQVAQLEKDLDFYAKQTAAIEVRSQRLCGCQCVKWLCWAGGAR